MPDITMCRGDGCPMANHCWRATAIPTVSRQSYFVKEPFTIEPQPHPAPAQFHCQYFWPNTTAQHEMRGL